MIGRTRFQTRFSIRAFRVANALSSAWLHLKAHFDVVNAARLAEAVINRNHPSNRGRRS